MDLPLVTDEQRERFTKEFLEHWNVEAPCGHVALDTWITCSAYREMQVQNLLSTVNGPLEVAL